MKYWRRLLTYAAKYKLKITLEIMEIKGEATYHLTIKDIDLGVDALGRCISYTFPAYNKLGPGTRLNQIARRILKDITPGVIADLKRIPK